MPQPSDFSMKMRQHDQRVELEDARQTIWEAGMRHDAIKALCDGDGLKSGGRTVLDFGDVVQRAYPELTNGQYLNLETAVEILKEAAGELADGFRDSFIDQHIAAHQERML